MSYWRDYSPRLYAATLVRQLEWETQEGKSYMGRMKGKVFTAHETRLRMILSFAARTSARYLVSAALKENVFRIGDD